MLSTDFQTDKRPEADSGGDSTRMRGVIDADDYKQFIIVIIAENTARVEWRFIGIILRGIKLCSF